MKVLAAMSGGVDSSVAAALLLHAGHDVTGVTMKLWGGPSDTGCCSVSDVDDARRVAQQLDIPHFVFNFADAFTSGVVDPYVADHAAGRTPNPCIECNRHVKFDALFVRAAQLGFDAVATGHHARVVDVDGRRRVGRAADTAKDQSYVLHMLTAARLAGCLFPVGDLSKAEVRAVAGELGLRTADKADSQDVCFITAAGRESFLGERIPLRPGRLVDTSGAEVGRTAAIELVTVGQRKGLDLGGAGERRYALGVDTATTTVTVGTATDLVCERQGMAAHVWPDEPLPPGTAVLAQTSAHGPVAAATIEPGATLRWDEPHDRVAPGQAVVFYDRSDRFVVGGATAA